MHKYIANEIINRKQCIVNRGFSKHSFIYRNTNENIQGYLNLLPINNRDILCVASSGDHALLSLLNKAKTVETYDLNHFAKFYQELKLSAYQVLEYNDFINFFYTEKGFTYDIFEKINNLPPSIKDFWQYLFDYNDDYDIIDSQLFSNFEYDYNTLKKFHPFLNESYFKEHKTIHNLTFYQSNILDLPIKLNKKYDVIMLSSIPNFIKEFYNLENFKIYLEKLSLLLKKDGYIICNYLYNIDLKSTNPFKNDQDLKETFNDDSLEKIIIPSFNDGLSDAVLIYQK